MVIKFQILQKIWNEILVISPFKYFNKVVCDKVLSSTICLLVVELRLPL